MRVKWGNLRMNALESFYYHFMHLINITNKCTETFDMVINYACSHSHLFLWRIKSRLVFSITAVFKPIKTCFRLKLLLQHHVVPINDWVETRGWHGCHKKGLLNPRTTIFFSAVSKSSMYLRKKVKESILVSILQTFPTVMSHFLMGMTCCRVNLQNLSFLISLQLWNRMGLTLTYILGPFLEKKEESLWSGNFTKSI